MLKWHFLEKVLILYGKQIDIFNKEKRNYMDLEVLKFGGSSLSNNENLRKVIKRLEDFLKKSKKCVVIVSAQGKATDNLLKEATELSNFPNKRELDMLLSTGEQISCSKFAILLNEMGYKATSLTGWQAGILTNSEFNNAKIQDIYPSRIWEELENNDVVIIAGFQGIDNKGNITTLGRDGSDTTAVSIAAALEQKHCYIFTDIDGIYDKDPNQFPEAKKIKRISYEQMEDLAKKGAKVLQDRCIRIAKKYQIKIIVASSFAKKEGSIVE